MREPASRGQDPPSFAGTVNLPRRDSWGFDVSHVCIYTICLGTIQNVCHPHVCVLVFALARRSVLLLSWWIGYTSSCWAVRFVRCWLVGP